MNSDRAKWLAVAAAALLAGCVHDSAGTAPLSTFGEANRQTMLTQVVEPDNQYDTVVPPASAGKAAQATDRYRKDAVKKPDRVRSTTVSSGSGSGSGSNP